MLSRLPRRSRSLASSEVLWRIATRTSWSAVRRGWCAWALPGDDGLDAGVRGEIAQERVATRVAALERPLQLDVEALAPERARELGGGVRVADAEPVARAAGEADEAVVQLREQRRVERGRQSSPSFGPRLRVRGGEEAAEVRVALRRLDEDGHVRAAVRG